MENVNVSAKFPYDENGNLREDIDSIVCLAFESHLSFEQLIDFVHAYLFLSMENTKKAREIFPLKSKKKLIKLDQFESLKMAWSILSTLVDVVEKARNGELDEEEERDAN